MTERRKAIDAAMRNVEQAADPQTKAASRIVTWVTGGLLKPTGDDLAMVRLILLALLPQISGILLMIGRAVTPGARHSCGCRFRTRRDRQPASICSGAYHK